MTEPAGERLYTLCFEHRGSCKKGLFGIPGGHNKDEHKCISGLTHEGFTRAIADGVPPDSCAQLVDEEFGAEIARSARRDRCTLATLVERSGRDEFDSEIREFGEHVGRTIRLEALGGHVAGRLERDVTIGQIAANYSQMIDLYAMAAAGASPARPARAGRGSR